MSNWLDPLRAALDASDSPISFFVRDDDAGWADAQLFTLLDIFERHDAPIDLAAIPAHITADCAAQINKRRLSHAGLRLHQHGFAHVNHEPVGRKCEFGESRDTLRQQADIRQGKERLTAFIESCDPVFTPPWNRCTQATVLALGREGFRILSRESRATPLEMGSLAQIPVSIDWRKRAADGNRETPSASLDRLIAQVRGNQQRIGLMLHHEALDEDDHVALGDLLGLMTSSGRVSCRNIVELGEQHEAPV